MRILHISWEYPPVIYGGLGRHVEALTRAQAAAGHEVIVVTQRPAEPLTQRPAVTLIDPPAAAYRDRALEALADPSSIEWFHGVQVIRTPNLIPPVPRDLPGLLSWTADLDEQLAQTIASVAGPAPAAIHAHDWVVHRAAQRAIQRWSAPLVVTIHATEAGRHAGWISGPASESIYAAEWDLTRRANLVITCSRAMAIEAQTLYELEPNEVVTIPNGIDLEPSRIESPAGAADAGAGAAGAGEQPSSRALKVPLVVFVGRLEWEKGVQILVEAARILEASGFRLEVEIAGTGTQAERFQELAADLDTVRFEGRIPDQDIYRLYRRADIVVVPSLYEPFGMVALEAAAAQAPLIVSNAGGLTEIVAPGRTGLVVPLNDAAALAAAIQETLSHPDLARQRALALRKELPDRYGWPAISNQTIGAYARAAAEHHTNGTPQREPSSPRQTSGRLLPTAW